MITYTNETQAHCSLSAQPSSSTFSSVAIPLLVLITLPPSPSKTLTSNQILKSVLELHFQWSQILYPVSHRPWSASFHHQGVLHEHWPNTTTTTTNDVPSHIDLFPILRQNSSPRAKWHNAWPGPPPGLATCLLLWVCWTRKVVADGTI